MLKAHNYYECEKCDALLSSLDVAISHLKHAHTSNVATQYEDPEALRKEINERQCDLLDDFPSKASRSKKSRPKKMLVAKAKEETLLSSTEESEEQTFFMPKKDEEAIESKVNKCKVCHNRAAHRSFDNRGVPNVCYPCTKFFPRAIRFGIDRIPCNSAKKGEICPRKGWQWCRYCRYRSCLEAVSW